MILDHCLFSFLQLLHQEISPYDAPETIPSCWLGKKHVMALELFSTCHRKLPLDLEDRNFGDFPNVPSLYLQLASNFLQHTVIMPSNNSKDNIYRLVSCSVFVEYLQFTCNREKLCNDIQALQVDSSYAPIYYKDIVDPATAVEALIYTDIFDFDISSELDTYVQLVTQVINDVFPLMQKTHWSNLRREAIHCILKTLVRTQDALFDIATAYPADIQESFLQALINIMKELSNIQDKPMTLSKCFQLLSRLVSSAAQIENNDWRTMLREKELFNSFCDLNDAVASLKTIEASLCYNRAISEIFMFRLEIENYVKTKELFKTFVSGWRTLEVAFYKKNKTEISGLSEDILMEYSSWARERIFLCNGGEILVQEAPIDETMKAIAEQTKHYLSDLKKDQGINLVAIAQSVGRISEYMQHVKSYSNSSILNSLQALSVALEQVMIDSNLPPSQL
jgi:hypothetical protein